MLNRLSIHLSTSVLLGVAVIAWLAPVPATAQTDTVNICDRTPQVEAAILRAINPAPACEAVPETDLAAIRGLDLRETGITSLASGDFTGLSALERLNLDNNALTTLPAGVFDSLPTLNWLGLGGNAFTTLPAGIESLSALVFLDLSDNALTTLPTGVFDSLPTLNWLSLGDNALTTLPTGVFDSLPTLNWLSLGGNAFTALPAGVFDSLPELTGLNLSNNAFTTLPDGVFDSLSALELLNLDRNNLTTLPAGVFDSLSALEHLDLRYNDFTTLPAGVFDHVLDTLGLINPPLRFSFLDPVPRRFFVDGIVRRAHFVCSRADADAIVAATAGVDDCLRITSAQLNIALQNAVTANDQLTDAIDALDIPGDGVVNPDLLQRISNVLADAGDFADIVAADLAGEDITVDQAIDFLATLNAALEPAGTAIQAGAEVEMATVTGIIDGIGEVIVALDSEDSTLSPPPTLVAAVQSAVQTILVTVSDLVADDADPDSTEAILDSASQVVNAVLGLFPTLHGDFKAAVQSLSEVVLRKSVDDIAVQLGRDRTEFTFTDTVSMRVLLAENTTLLDRVLEVTGISLGRTQLGSTSVTQFAIDAGVSAEGAEALAEDVNQFVTRPAFLLEIDGQFVGVLDLLNDALLGFGAATVDNTTGTVEFASDAGTIEAFVTAVAIVPDSVPEGVFITPDGSALSIADGVAISLAPSPADPIEFVRTIESVGDGEYTTTIRGNGAIALTHTATGAVFNATFAFDVIGSGEPVAMTTFTTPEGNDPADPDYKFSVTFEDGSMQSILPMIASPQFYDSMTAMGFEMQTDRSTGVISINGARFRADYISWPATSFEILFWSRNADASGVAYMPTDANGDGITDYIVITRINGVATGQIVYELP